MQTFYEDMIEAIKTLQFSDTFDDSEEEDDIRIIEDELIIDDNPSINIFRSNLTENESGSNK